MHLSFILYLSVFVLSHSLCSNFAITLDFRKDKIDNHLHDKRQKLPPTVEPPHYYPICKAFTNSNDAPPKPPTSQ
jgi:hypothetical protein